MKYKLLFSPKAWCGLNDSVNLSPTKLDNLAAY
jgi:hypothetical protein